ncbi:MAG: Tat pathway signal protein [Acidobacteriota bacterium]|nr:Tat pathway signal protein [Acidobacteriota bacterium]
MHRRQFLQSAALATAAIAAPAAPVVPWYRRTVRWGQTNITERDPIRYDIPFWRDFWKRTAIQGVIINAGGIVAYYPSKFPLHHRAQFLNGRDLYGDLVKAARADGLAVVARMDSNRAAEDFFQAHPDWFARMANGLPYRAADKYVACINSPYYDEYLPDVMREIIDRSHPDGFTDNSWAGLGRASICYCPNCRRGFRAHSGQDLPARADWDAPVYRQWILWNYQRRTELWEFNNRVTRDAGGPDCIWSGMNSGSVTAQASSFRDLREIARRAAILMLDHQRRDDATGFQQNGDTGKRVHQLMGWEKLAPESMAMYQAGRATFRASAKPAAEARMWMIAGIAGGIQPWWHHIGAYQEDRRAYRTAEPVMQWHRANQQYLRDRRPIATVGLLWSQRNTDFYGRDNAAALVDAPYQGFAQALIRARIPYLPVHAADLDRDAPGLSVLVLANVAALSDAECDAVRRFVQRGGSLIGTGKSTGCDEWGDPRPDFALADLFRVHRESAPARSPRGGAPSSHTYLRLHPEYRARVWGPETGREPAPAGERHPVLRGFEETDILPFGGTLAALRVDAGADVPLTFVPEYPVYPPETAWMREPDTRIPALALSRAPGGGRVAFLPADLDRRYFQELLPDHGNLLANLVRWAADASIPLAVEGAGLVDCHLYRQQSRLILHLVNLTSAGTWRSPMDELIPVGPFTIRVRIPEGLRPRAVQRLVDAGRGPVSVNGGWAQFEVRRILDHEVVVIA